MASLVHAPDVPGAHPEYYYLSVYILYSTCSGFISVLGNNVVPDQFATNDVFLLEIHITETGQVFDDVHEFADTATLLLPGQIRLPEVTAKDQSTVPAGTGDDRIELMKIAVGELIYQNITIVKGNPAHKRGGDELDDVFLFQDLVGITPAKQFITDRLVRCFIYPGFILLISRHETHVTYGDDTADNIDFFLSLFKVKQLIESKEQGEKSLAGTGQAVQHQMIAAIECFKGQFLVAGEGGYFIDAEMLGFDGGDRYQFGFFVVVRVTIIIM